MSILTTIILQNLIILILCLKKKSLTLCSISKRTPRFYLDGDQRMEVLQYIV